VLTLERIEPFRRIDESLMLRAPVLHALVLLGTTCQLTTGPRLTMPASGGMPGGPVATVTIQDFSFSPATLSVRVGSTIQWTNKGPSPHTATSDLGVWDSGQLSPPRVLSVHLHDDGHLPLPLLDPSAIPFSELSGHHHCHPVTPRAA